jgi:hypothetical protein
VKLDTGLPKWESDERSVFEVAALELDQSPPSHATVNGDLMPSRGHSKCPIEPLYVAFALLRCPRVHFHKSHGGVCDLFEWVGRTVVVYPRPNAACVSAVQWIKGLAR